LPYIKRTAHEPITQTCPIRKKIIQS
jgi:hypothetical protein